MAHKTENNILETSATLGTGDLTLDGAVPSYLPFSSKLAVGDTCHYHVVEVDTVGRPTGLREWGKGTFRAGNKLERTTVHGPVSRTKVNFTGAAKMVGLTILAPNADTQADWRTLLGVNLTNNTSDANKPISTAAANAFSALAQDLANGLAPKANTATTVQKDSDTGAAQLPVGTHAQRPQPDKGLIRFNDDLKRPEIGNGAAFVSLGGAAGGGNDSVFYENDTRITADSTIQTGKNALSAGPITIDTGVVVTVESGSVWTIS